MGEKKLLELINALVSHEMRNPLNSINSMIMKLKLVIETLYGNVVNPSLSDSDFRKEVLSFVDDMTETCDVL